MQGSVGNDRIDLSGVSVASGFTHASGVSVRVEGNAGADSLIGSAFADLLIGAADSDVLRGNSGADTLQGGDGADVLSDGSSNDVMDGGLGTDFFTEKADTNFTVIGLQVASTATGSETLVGIERIALVGGDGANRLDVTLASVPVILLGGNFNDVLVGGSRTATPATSGDGTDSLNGGLGTDTYDNDTLDSRPALEANEMAIATVFAGLPSWLDQI